MSYFYHYAAPEHREKTDSGGLNLGSHAWNESNGTYAFSYGLGCVIVTLGILIATHPLFPQVAAIGSLLVSIMACVILSFSIITPEAWVAVQGKVLTDFRFLLFQDC
jgi:uncharacterized membrane protein YkgB